MDIVYLKIFIMANVITVVGDNFVLNGRSSAPLGMSSLNIAGDAVNLRYSPGSVSWSLDYKNTTVDGATFPSVQELFDSLASFSKGGGTGEGVEWDDVENKPLKELITPIGDSEGLVPVYTQNGQLSVGMPEFPENAVPMALLDARIPVPPETGTFVLRSVDGVVSWVAE